MIEHPRTYLEPLTPEEVEAVYQAALTVLEEVGLGVQSAEMCRRLAEAGAAVGAAEQRVRMSPGFVETHLAAAPAQWTLHARNPKQNVSLGGRTMSVSPGYGSPWVADALGQRRPAALADFERFALLAGRCAAIDITGGLLVEPLDVPPERRALETTYALLRCSDKPWFGSVAGTAGAHESLQMARIVFGNLREKPVILGLININSPLRLDARMAEAMLEYVQFRQPVLLTPGILMGITAPVTAIGALV
jgi:trimethylamine---corrinoid protein Co-methyltransferase